VDRFVEYVAKIFSMAMAELNVQYSPDYKEITIWHQKKKFHKQKQNEHNVN
jgi:hypothetical protein